VRRENNRLKLVTAWVTHNWREKLMAVLLAFLFWYLVRSQAVVRRGYLYEQPNFPARGQL
jgi:hypothetical protein